MAWLAGAETAAARLRTGASLLVRTDDYEGRAIYYFGDQDPRVTWVCRQVLRRGDTVIDVGANWGVIALHCASLVGDGGAVHAFEPQPELAAALERSVALNGFRHVHVYPVGLSDADVEGELAVPASHTGAASLHGLPAWAPADAGSLIRVRLCRADTCLPALRIPAVRLMKIDVEGHEAQVLRGASGLFAETPPDVVVIEHNQPGADFWEQPPIRFLLERGYRLGAIPRSPWSRRVHWLRPPEPGVIGHDFVALREGPDNAALIGALGAG